MVEPIVCQCLHKVDAISTKFRVWQEIKTKWGWAGGRSMVYSNERNTKFCGGWIFTDSRSLPFHGLSFTDACTHTHYVLYNQAYFIIFAVRESFAKNTEIGPLENFPLYGSHKPQTWQRFCNDDLHVHVRWPNLHNISINTIFLYIIWSTVAAVFIATYLWPNVSAMILYEVDLGTLIFINTSCRMNI